MVSIQSIALNLKEGGGRLLVVGGFVRDQLLGLPAKDYDCEVYGLPLDTLEALLARHGHVQTVGRAFGVLRIKGHDIDFSLPRRDSKTGDGHRGFTVEVDPNLSFPEASLRRDLTINSIGWDPLTDEYLDPHNGRADLTEGILRATSPKHFPEDPLRGLRVAQFAARFEMTVDPLLENLCRKLDLTELPAERLYQEFHKLLLKGTRPSLGLEFLKASHQLRFFPELAALPGVPQDPRWHPEGDVWVHTLLALDAGAGLRAGSAFEQEVLMFGLLCHDLGKPETTEEEAGRIRSHRHEQAGLRPTETFLNRLRTGKDLLAAVKAVVANHLAPAQFIRNNASPAAYRRLARRLAPAKVSLTLLEKVARADALGRTTDDALAGRFPAGDAFLEVARSTSVESGAIPDVVLGRHLVAAGYSPGPEFGVLISRCRKIQDETGWSDPQKILRQALDEAEKNQ